MSTRVQLTCTHKIDVSTHCEKAYEGVYDTLTVCGVVLNTFPGYAFNKYTFPEEGLYSKERYITVYTSREFDP